MAADCKDVNLDMVSQQHQAAGDTQNHGEGPTPAITVPTVSEKVPEERVDGKKARVPRRILHFSDGTMEEYSTDEDEPDRPPPDALAHLRAENPKAMGWVPWTWYWFRYAGYRTLSSVDNVGEKLAYMLGITSPKYQYELDEYYEMKKKEEEEKAQRDLEEAGWTSGTALTSATNPSAYLVTGDEPAPVTAPPDQSAPVTAPPDQSAAVTAPPDQSAAGTALTTTNPAAYLVTGDQSAPAAALPDQSAAGVSGQPVAANTAP